VEPRRAAPRSVFVEDKTNQIKKRIYLTKLTAVGPDEDNGGSSISPSKRLARK